jgi:acyl-coenzyme A synthetase/AMP-(fatty) acid ligase
MNVAAVGVPDEVRTEIVKAFIVLRNDKTPAVGVCHHSISRSLLITLILL